MTSKRTKILFILHIPPPVHGAAMVGQFIQQSKLINDTFDCDYINLSTSKHLNDINKSGFRKLIVIIRLYVKVLRTVLRNRYDMCYLTINSKGISYYKEMVLVILLKIFNYKLIYHYHNKGIANSKKNWLIKRLYRFQFRSSRVILISTLLYPDIKEYVPKDKVYYCANGIPIIRNLNLDLLNSNRLKKTVAEILFLSNMMKEKGVYTLLEACSILQSRGIKFKSIFIGEWSDINEQDFNKFVMSKNLQKRAFYSGKKYGNEKSVYFERADIFILPTSNDIFPLVNLEGMQYGLPIISTDEGAIPDLVEDNYNGFLVPPKNPSILADKIEYLINNPNTRFEMGRRGRKKLEECYSLEKFEQSFVKTIEEIKVDFSKNPKSKVHFSGLGHTKGDV